MTTLFDEVNRRNKEMKNRLPMKLNLPESELPEPMKPMKIMDALNFPHQMDLMSRRQMMDVKDEFGIDDIPMDMSSESEDEISIKRVRDELPGAGTTIFTLGPNKKKKSSFHKKKKTKAQKKQRAKQRTKAKKEVMKARKQLTKALKRYKKVMKM
jgi:hypothetical protein